MYLEKEKTKFIVKGTIYNEEKEDFSMIEGAKIVMYLSYGVSRTDKFVGETDENGIFLIEDELEKDFEYNY